MEGSARSDGVGDESPVEVVVMLLDGCAGRVPGRGLATPPADSNLDCMGAGTADERGDSLTVAAGAPWRHARPW